MRQVAVCRQLVVEYAGQVRANHKPEKRSCGPRPKGISTTMPVKNQIALVVGASSGIGRATAVMLAREGARVMASARREDRLKELQSSLAKEDHTIEIVPADASSPAQMEELAKQTRAR